MSKTFSSSIAKFADDVAALLSEMGYPCSESEARERIGLITANDRQALVVARSDASAQGCLERADAALYYSKRNGRNQSTLWSERLPAIAR